MISDPHDVANGGHEPVDVDPFIPTGQCALCVGVNVDERLPEDRGPDNPYDPGVLVDEPHPLVDDSEL